MKSISILAAGMIAALNIMPAAAAELVMDGTVSIDELADWSQADEGTGSEDAGLAAMPADRAPAFALGAPLGAPGLAEPQSWLLMIAGGAIVGMSLRRNGARVRVSFT